MKITITISPKDSFTLLNMVTFKRKQKEFLKKKKEGHHQRGKTPFKKSHLT